MILLPFNGHQRRWLRIPIFSFNPATRENSPHPTLGGVWGQRFRINQAIFSRFVSTSYCAPLYPGLLPPSPNIITWKNKKMKRRILYTTNQSFLQPWLFLHSVTSYFSGMLGVLISHKQRKLLLDTGAQRKKERQCYKHESYLKPWRGVIATVIPNGFSFY